jgi:hypothetical protein
MSIIKQVYKPSMTVGQVYARIYGSTALPMPIGNVLELSLEHDENVIKQDNMTTLGGGTYNEVRRVTEVKVKMKMADFNVTNMARGLLGTAGVIAAGTVTDEEHTATLGGLLPLAHIQPTGLTIKRGADKATAVEVTAAGNYEVRPEGVFISPSAAGLADADVLWVSYSHGEYANIEALTTMAVELELIFGGLNEADSGNPMVVSLYRVSQGVTNKLALISGKDFGALEVEGTLLEDHSKFGAGISRYYKVSMA